MNDLLVYLGIGNTKITVHYLSRFRSNIICSVASFDKFPMSVQRENVHANSNVQFNLINVKGQTFSQS